MSDFLLWFQLGLNHITDLQGYDHMLFLLITTCVFVLRDIRKVLILITGFTLGHSITLALSTLNYLTINSNLIEVCIPITIFITAIYQFLNKSNSVSNHFLKFEFIVVSIFGLIHGLGFSNMLKSMLGKEESIVKPLLFFNIGIEAGQCILVIFILIMSSLIINYLKAKRSIYISIISILIFLISAQMIYSRINSWINVPSSTTQIPQKESIFVKYNIKTNIENISNA